MKKIWAFLILALIYSIPGLAEDKAVGVIEAALKPLLPGVKPDSIKPSKMPGLYEVMVGAKLFYMSDDGNYLIQGSMIDVKSNEDLTESRLSVARLNGLDKLGVDKMIVFKPKIGKHVVYVFTDIDCGYCRKLHSEIDQYMREGIEIRYLFFPRAGEGSDSWNKAVSVWCSKDRNAALTQAKKGEKVDSKPCDNPVAEQYALGNALGETGTPMLVTDKGAILPGYVPAAQLSAKLNEDAKP